MKKRNIVLIIIGSVSIFLSIACYSLFGLFTAEEIFVKKGDDGNTVFENWISEAENSFDIHFTSDVFQLNDSEKVSIGSDGIVIVDGDDEIRVGKNGIFVDDGEDKIAVSPSGIYVDSGDGDVVSIGKLNIDKIKVKVD